MLEYRPSARELELSYDGAPQIVLSFSMPPPTPPPTTSGGGDGEYYDGDIEVDGPDGDGGIEGISQGGGDGGDGTDLFPPSDDNAAAATRSRTGRGGDKGLGLSTTGKTGLSLFLAVAGLVGIALLVDRRRRMAAAAAGGAGVAGDGFSVAGASNFDDNSTISSGSAGGGVV